MAVSIAAALVLSVPLGAVAEDALKEARQELRETKEKMRARAQKMRDIQDDMNRIATRIAATEAQIHQAKQRQEKLSRGIADLEAEHDRLQALLDERTREAYLLGPGMEMLYLLTATSAEDAVNRIGFLDEMNRRDAVLAKKVADAEVRLMSARWELERIQTILDTSREQLDRDHAELRKKMAESRRLYALLEQRKEVVLANISRLRLFGVPRRDRTRSRTASGSGCSAARSEAATTSTRGTTSARRWGHRSSRRSTGPPSPRRTRWAGSRSRCTANTGTYTTRTCPGTGSSAPSNAAM
jgi:peptidoglycan hydrolase CwlO-like protein